jgi:hypothetical protein
MVIMMHKIGDKVDMVLVPEQAVLVAQTLAWWYPLSIASAISETDYSATRLRSQPSICARASQHLLMLSSMSTALGGTGYAMVTGAKRAGSALRTRLQCRRDGELLRGLILSAAAS